jgi:hypothetical protein
MPSPLLVIAVIGLSLALPVAPARAGGVGPSTPPAKENSMSLNAGSSRVGRNVPHIVFDGLRYKEVLNGKLLDLPQRTGLLMIMDAATNARVDVVKIYDTPYDPGLEADVQDVFFTTFELVAGKREILIGNERGERYVFAIDTKAVRKAP